MRSMIGANFALDAALAKANTNAPARTPIVAAERARGPAELKEAWHDNEADNG